MSKLTIRYATLLPKQDSLLVGPSENAVVLAMTAAFEERLSVNRYNHDWRIGNFQIDPETGFASGRLGYPETEHEEVLRFDATRQVFETSEVEYPASVSAAFAFDPGTDILAFEEAEIGPTGFVNHLRALLDGTPYGPFEGELLSRHEPYREFVSRATRVTRVTFEVKPTNPRDKPIFRDLDRGLRAAGAAKEKVTLENDDGLVIDPPDSDEDTTDNPAVQGIEMVEAGYGTEFGYRLDADTPEGRERYTYTPEEPGVVAEVDEVEEAPDEPGSRLRIVIQFLRQRGQG